MSNPREFWCDITDEYDKGKCLVMECHIEKPPEWEKTHRVSEGLSIHVIEKSAYDKLELELTVLKLNNEKIVQLLVAAEAKLKIAVDGIKHLHKNAVFMDVVEGSKFMSDLLIKIETDQKAGVE